MDIHKLYRLNERNVLASDVMVHTMRENMYVHVGSPEGFQVVFDRALEVTNRVSAVVTLPAEEDRAAKDGDGDYDDDKDWFLSDCGIWYLNNLITIGGTDYDLSAKSAQFFQKLVEHNLELNRDCVTFETVEELDIDVSYIPVPPLEYDQEYFDFELNTLNFGRISLSYRMIDPRCKISKRDIGCVDLFSVRPAGGKVPLFFFV